MSKEENKFRTVKEMAEILRVSPKTFRNMVNIYNLPFIRAGVRGMRFDEAKVLKRLESHGSTLEIPYIRPKKKVFEYGVTQKELEFARSLGFNI